MTTVVDPGGTPAPVYNRSGITIVAVVGASTGSPTPIPHVSGHTIAIVSTGTPSMYTRLPDNAEIGDVVELYSDNGDSYAVYPPVGETIHGSSSASGYSNAFFRKVSATNWRRIGS